MGSGESENDDENGRRARPTPARGRRSLSFGSAECTFIVYDRDLESPDSPTAAMAGDVNLFFLEKDRSEAEIMVMTAEPASRRKGMGSEAALLMIRYGSCWSAFRDPLGVRGARGVREEGWSHAVRESLSAGVEELGVKRFTAKISDSNEASIQMFTRLGFGEPKTVAVFSEVHLHLDATDPTVLEYEPRCRVMK